MVKAAFIDRDGTVIKNSEKPIKEPSQIEYEENAVEGLRLLKKLGLELIMISNQGGINAGVITEMELKTVNDAMLSYLRQRGVNFLDNYYCPHKSDEGCYCRKPGTALFEEAIIRHEINPLTSWTIGDKIADIMAGYGIGSRTILVETGNAGKDGQYSVKPSYRAKDLIDAAKIIEHALKFGY
jgi:histidinol-phosphate phosphatase family protein